MVTKRTVFLACAAVVAALALSGCGGPADEGPAAAALPAATQQVADVDEAGTPSETAVPDETADADEATTAPEVAAPKQVITKTVTETKSIAFNTRTVNDSTLAKGKKKTRTNGKAGVRTLTYQVTLTDGKQTAKKLLRSVVTRAPVTKVVAIGTKKASSSGCDPNYSGACVPIASDVDCAGGSGNGPAFVDGPVHVIGSDIYDLDRDGDGVACDD